MSTAIVCARGESGVGRKDLMVNTEVVLGRSNSAGTLF